MKFTLSINEAAELANVTRRTIERALSDQRLSFQTNNQGHRLLDPEQVREIFPKQDPPHQFIPDADLVEPPSTETRRLRNRKTGCVFLWHKEIAKRDDMELIS